MALFEDAGEIVQRLDVADMREQIAARERRLGARRAPGSSPSSAGDGHARRCSRDSARYVVDGGPTLNPSTYELLAGIHEVPGRGGARAAQLAAT